MLHLGHTFVPDNLFVSVVESCCCVVDLCENVKDVFGEIWGEELFSELVLPDLFITFDPKIDGDEVRCRNFPESCGFEFEVFETFPDENKDDNSATEARGEIGGEIDEVDEVEFGLDVGADTDGGVSCDLTEVGLELVSDVEDEVEFARDDPQWIQNIPGEAIPHTLHSLSVVKSTPEVVNVIGFVVFFANIVLGDDGEEDLGEVGGEHFLDKDLDSFEGSSDEKPLLL